MATLSFLPIILSALLSFDSCALATPAPKAVVDLMHPVGIVLPQTTNETMAKMREVFPFIDVDTLTQNPTIDFGLRVINDPAACNTMKEADKLTILYRQLKIFQRPVELMYSSTLNIKSKPLKASILTTTNSFHDAIHATELYMSRKHIAIPSVRSVDKTVMDQKTATYLDRQVTPDEISNYRNYVIMYVLFDVLENGARNCIPSNK